MNTAAEVNISLVGWLNSGMEKAEVVVRLAQACIGWPYVFGAVGEECTPKTRQKYYNNYINRDPAEAEQIKKTCRVLNLGVGTCNGCKFYPGGTVRCYDCRGFTRWVLSRVGFSLQGAGATSQWNNNDNWEFKGTIDQYNGGLAVFFQQSTTDKKKMSHTGFLIGNGQIVHCSGTVKQEALYKKITHFAIPKGLGGDIPVPTTKPTLKRGSRGPYVTLAQTELIAKGFSCGDKGADGIFGKATEQATKDFQRAVGLKVDGIIGPATWEKLDSGEIQYFRVIIPHLTEPQADDLCKEYPNATKEKEGDE